MQELSRNYICKRRIVSTVYWHTACRMWIVMKIRTTDNWHHMQGVPYGRILFFIGKTRLIIPRRDSLIGKQKTGLRVMSSNGGQHQRTASFLGLQAQRFNTCATCHEDPRIRFGVECKITMEESFQND
jgi:hypothetical protein